MEDTETIDPATAAMAAAGVATETGLYVDYFDFDDTRKVNLPDGRSWVEIQVLNEGARRKYLNSTNKDVTIQRATGDAKMRIQSGDDRLHLLESAIVDWNLQTKDTKTGQMVAVKFDERALRRFLDNAPPAIIDLIEKEVRKDNEWLRSDVTVQDIDEQIEELKELREKILERDEGNES